MTEDEWLAEGQSAETLVRFLLMKCQVHQRPRARQLRLLLSACARRVAHLLCEDERLLFEANERYADRLTHFGELARLGTWEDSEDWLTAPALLRRLALLDFTPHELLDMADGFEVGLLLWFGA